MSDQSNEQTLRQWARDFSTDNDRDVFIAAADEIASLRAQVEQEISKLIADRNDLRAQLASAMKALEGVYDHMDRNGMANWPVAKRVRKELDSLTDEKGDSK